MVRDEEDAVLPAMPIGGWSGAPKKAWCYQHTGRGCQRERGREREGERGRGGEGSGGEGGFLSVMFETSTSYVNASGWMVGARMARINVRVAHKVLESLVVDGGPAHGDN